jgi:hypothetical protein
MDSFAQAVYNSLNIDGLLDDNPAAATLFGKFISALGTMFQQQDDLVQIETDSQGKLAPSWSILMDIDRLPDEGLGWFSQFMGVALNPNLSANDQRQQIRNHAGWNRGTPATLAAAVQALLTGTKTVQYIERDTTPYHFTISTYTTETPNSAAVTAAIIANKPAGLQFTYTVIAGSPGTTATYQNLYLDYASDALVFNSNTAYQDVYLHP